MSSIILASGSPRRKQLLESAGISFSVVVSDADESFPSEMPVTEVPEHIAKNKALASSRMVEGDHLILAADTIVILEGKVIGKPVDKEDAVRMLEALSGKKHHVFTGVAIIYDGIISSFTDVTEVEFYPLTAVQISYYVENFLPLDKAGAYAIQEWIGFVGIKGIEGDYYNVMGLPVSRVLRALNELIKI